MSWIKEQKRTWAEWAVIRILKVGPIPHHVAFIMDGNRRFAQQMQKDAVDGHHEGFNKLTEVLSWCYDLNINEVTVYAFSIENFKRPKAEVDGLMHLAEEKFAKLLDEIDRLKEHGVCIRVIGKISLLTQKLQVLVAKAILATKYNNRCFLNLALAYTSRDEIMTAISEIKTGIIEKRLMNSDISESLIGKSLYTGEIINPDLLIRTSGEVRLSDFLLWQCGLTHLVFTKVLWPQISIWHLLAAVFQYQRHHHTLQNLRNEELSRMKNKEDENDFEQWTAEGKHENFKEYLTKQQARTIKFIDDLRQKRLEELITLSQQSS